MMQSKNILWLGLLFVILLTAFCISKYINQFHPDIQTISNPKKEIVIKDTKLSSSQLPTPSTNYKEDKDKVAEDKVAEDYLQIIELIEQEEKDIENAYKQALEEEKQKNLQKRVKP